MSRICCYITTYNRPDELMDVLRDIAREAAHGAGKYHIDVHVYDDHSLADYTQVQQYLQAQGWRYVQAEANYGKRRYWEWMTRIYGELKRSSAKYFVQLPDDVRLCTDFFVKLTQQWSEIRDPKKILLNPLHDLSRSTGTCWTGVPPVPAGDVDRVGWADMCMLTTREYFEEVDWRIQPIPTSRWVRAANVSSGVGAQISTRLLRADRTMYRSVRSLVVHRFLGSQMNPAERCEVSMAVKDYVGGPKEAIRLAAGDEVSASLAAVPERMESLEQTVASLLPQVCGLFVYLNGYPDVPAFLQDPGVTVARSQDSGDLGDAGKFWWSREQSGFCLTCDDDLVYPGNYAERLVASLWSHSLRAAVGAHGARVLEPVVSYYRSRQLFHCLGDVDTDTRVHILGTGAMAYHTSSIRVTPGDFQAPNMADIWFAALGQRQKIPFICIAHRAGWLQHVDHEETIYSRFRERDTLQTIIVRSLTPWDPSFAPLPAAAPTPAPPAPVRAPMAQPARRRRTRE